MGVRETGGKVSGGRAVGAQVSQEMGGKVTCCRVREIQQAAK